MKEVDVANKEIKAVLEEVVSAFYLKRDDLADIIPDCDKEKDQRDAFTSEEYLHKIQGQGRAHDGFPEVLYSYNLKNMDYGTNLQMQVKKALPVNWLQKWSELNLRMQTALSTRNCAVASLYPPGGYISWHNNANATGFNLIFTWSETGDGWFDYIDESDNRIRLQDKAGEWVCRYGMFGSYDQTDYPIVYHAASTDCWRITLAFVFDPSASSGDLQEFIIDELITP